MTKGEFRRHVIISSILTVIATSIIIAFCIFSFIQYTNPNDNNTSISGGTVEDIYHVVKKNGVIVEMANGDRLQLVYPNFSSELFSEIGYDLDELCKLLEGEEIEYRRINMIPWIVEIYVDDIVIDNNLLTVKQITLTRIAIVILGIIMLSFPVAGEVSYIKSKYKFYKEAEKKRARKTKRDLKKLS